MSAGRRSTRRHISQWGCDTWMAPIRSRARWSTSVQLSVRRIAEGGRGERNGLVNKTNSNANTDKQMRTQSMPSTIMTTVSTYLSMRGWFGILEYATKATSCMVQMQVNRLGKGGHSVGERSIYILIDIRWINACN